MAKSVVVEDLYMRYFGGDLGVDMATFSINGDGVFAIYGKAQSGKSTVLRCIAGLEKYQGKIELSEIKDIVYSFDTKSLKMYSTVLENLLIPLKLRGVENAEDIALSRMKKYGIEDLKDKKVRELSLDEKSIVVIARCFERDADLYLLDDVLKNIDDRHDEILNILKDDLKGKMVVFATSNIDDAFSVSDTVSIMAYKKYIQRGTKEELLKCPKSRETLMALKNSGVINTELKNDDKGYYVEVSNLRFDVNEPISNIYVGKEVSLSIVNDEIYKDVYFDKSTDYVISKR